MCINNTNWNCLMSIVRTGEVIGTDGVKRVSER